MDNLSGISLHFKAVYFSLLIYQAQSIQNFIMKEPISINSISNFFKISHYQYCIFDIGHKVYQLSNQHFKRIEKQQDTYPTPFKQEAWLGILFWQPNIKKKPVIWFIHLPIDEIGLLKLETRDNFIQQILEQVGKKITPTHEDNQQKNTIALQKQQESSPFAFKPNQEKMAIFNALAKKILNQAVSQYYPHVIDYLQGKIGYEQWSFLGVQGIADVIVQLDTEKTAQQSLIKAIPHLPDTPLITFGQMLEHVHPSPLLSTVLLSRLETEMNMVKPNLLLQAALIRALSSAQSNEHRQRAVIGILQHKTANSIEILAAIASRAWETLLNNKQLLKQFLEVLAIQPQESFDGLLLSLMSIPTMQSVVRNELRSPKRSKKLEEKIDGFMQRFA